MRVMEHYDKNKNINIINNKISSVFNAQTHQFP